MVNGQVARMDGWEGGSWTEGHSNSRKVRHKQYPTATASEPLLLLARLIHFIDLDHEISDENGNQQHLVIHVDFW